MNPATCACLPTSTPTYKVSRESMGRGTRSGREDVVRGMSHPAFPASLPAAWLLQHTEYVGGEARSRGRASTNFGPEVWLQPHIRCANTPPRFFSRVKLQSVRRVLRDRGPPGATRLCFSTSNSTYVLLKNQEDVGDLLSEAIGIFSRVPA